MGVFPRDSPRNMRFAINFFTSIGLGGALGGAAGPCRGRWRCCRVRARGVGWQSRLAVEAGTHACLVGTGRA